MPPSAGDGFECSDALEELLKVFDEGSAAVAGIGAVAIPASPAEIIEAGRVRYRTGVNPSGGITPYRDDPTTIQIAVTSRRRNSDF
jgi:hypothetical protein